MMVITRRKGQAVHIEGWGDITVTDITFSGAYLRINDTYHYLYYGKLTNKSGVTIGVKPHGRQQVKVGIHAPKEMLILRSELLLVASR